jgi:hypothetical protein
MADQVMSAEKVRAMLTENLDRVRKASNEYFQMLEKGLGSSQLPIADHAKQFTDLMQRNVAATFEHCDKLIKANDAQDAIRNPGRILPGPDARHDGPSQGHGRNRHEGHNWGVCSERRKFTGLRPRPLPRHTCAGAVRAL